MSDDDIVTMFTVTAALAVPGALVLIACLEQFWVWRSTHPKKETCPMGNAYTLPVMVEKLRTAVENIKNFSTYTTHTGTVVHTAVPTALQHAVTLIQEVLDVPETQDISFLRACVAEWDKKIPAEILDMQGTNQENTDGNTVCFDFRYKKLLHAWEEQKKTIAKNEALEANLRATCATVDRQTEELQLAGVEKAAHVALLAAKNSANETMTNNLQAMEAERNTLKTRCYDLETELASLVVVRRAYNELLITLPETCQLPANPDPQTIGGTWYRLSTSVGKLVAQHARLAKAEEERVAAIDHFAELRKEKAALEQMVTDTEALSNQRATRNALLEEENNTLRKAASSMMGETTYLSAFNSLLHQAPLAMLVTNSPGPSTELARWSDLCGTFHNLKEYHVKNAAGSTDKRWEDAVSIMLRGIPATVRDRIKPIQGLSIPMQRWEELCHSIAVLKKYYEEHEAQLKQYNNPDVVVKEDGVKEDGPVATPTPAVTTQEGNLDTAEGLIQEALASRRGLWREDIDKLGVASQNIVNYLRAREVINQSGNYAMDLVSSVFGFQHKIEASSGTRYHFGFTTMQQRNAFCAAITFVNRRNLRVTDLRFEPVDKSYNVTVLDTTS
jgi:hypothetical protein